MSTAKKNLALSFPARVSQTIKRRNCLHFLKDISNLLKYLIERYCLIVKYWQFLKIQGCGRVAARYLANLGILSHCSFNRCVCKTRIRLA